MNYHLQFDLAFTRNTYPGKYYAIEGIDGSGKTTQVQKLSEYFEKQGKEVCITKEPSNSIVGELIHKVVYEEISLPAVSLQYLFAADRGIHLEQEVIPALKKGCVVISDRSFWSAVAYGITDLELPDNEKERLLIAYNILTMYGGFLVPDKTLVIDIPYDIAIKRIQERKKEITLYEKAEKLAKVQKEYQWMEKKFSDMLGIIDGIKSIDEVHKLIIERIKK